MRSVVVALAAAVAVASAVNVEVGKTGCTTSSHFDYLELELQWPVTNCKAGTGCNGTDAFFTIHGKSLLCARGRSVEGAVLLFFF